MAVQNQVRGVLKDQQIRALRGSIGKWMVIVDAIKHSRPFTENGMSDCECCTQFLKGPSTHCENCPICLHTGAPDCNETPYGEWLESTQWASDFTPKNFTGEQYPHEYLRTAKKELKFLIKLVNEYDK